MKNMRMMAFVAVMGVVMVAAAVETEPCERWDDIGTNLALPDHDGLPPYLTFPRPSLDLPVSPHFKNR